MSNQPAAEKSKNKKKSALIAIIASLGVALVATISYMTLAKIKEQQLIADVTQEQFVGTVQVSEQLQSECQRSAEKITALSESNDAAAMFAEYRQNAENCREVYFVTEKKSTFRSEGTYPDLIVDIALMTAKTNKAQAGEMLKFAKNLNDWEFYLGPIVCSSKTTIEAYLESLNLPEEKICFKTGTDKEKLFSEIKNKNFSVFSASLNNNRVVSLGLINAEVGCPEKLSTIIKLAQKASAGNLTIEEEKRENSDTNGISFVFKTDTENRLVLVFAVIDNCLQLQSVSVPEQQVNE